MNDFTVAQRPTEDAFRNNAVLMAAVQFAIGLTGPASSLRVAANCR